MTCSLPTKGPQQLGDMRSPGTYAHTLHDSNAASPCQRVRRLLYDNIMLCAPGTSVTMKFMSQASRTADSTHWSVRQPQMMSWRLPRHLNRYCAHAGPLSKRDLASYSHCSNAHDIQLQCRDHES